MNEQKITRYCPQTDELIPIDQEWVNSVQNIFMKFGFARAAAKRAIGIQDGIVVSTHPALQEFLDAWKPEFEQEPIKRDTEDKDHMWRAVRAASGGQ